MPPDHITNLLLGIFAASFLAWAGVVWHASSKAISVATLMQVRLDATLSQIVTRLERLEQRMTDHEQLRAHQGAASDMESVRHEVASLQDRHREDVSNIRAEMRDYRERMHEAGRNHDGG